jgi:hypothetical protein
VSLNIRDLPPDLLNDVVVQSARVFVCPTMLKANAISAALHTLRGNVVDPMIYTFAAGQYLVVLMGEVERVAKDGSEPSS